MVCKVTEQVQFSAHLSDQNQSYAILFPIVDYQMNMKENFGALLNSRSYRLTNIQIPYTISVHFL